MGRETVWGLIALGLIGAIMTRNKISLDVNAAINNENVNAFLNTIGRFESNNDYTVLYGGGHFDDFSGHPNIHVPFHNPLRSGDGINDYSTAAGKYQINYPTWLAIQAVAFLPDFSPASQDLAAVWLLKMRGALDDVVSGNFSVAILTASKTWASLPGSQAGQNPKSYNEALNAYTNYGGKQA